VKLVQVVALPLSVVAGFSFLVCSADGSRVPPGGRWDGWYDWGKSQC
jgi:hypothetical protein